MLVYFGCELLISLSHVGKVDVVDLRSKIS